MKMSPNTTYGTWKTLHFKIIISYLSYFCNRNKPLSTYGAYILIPLGMFVIALYFLWAEELFVIRNQE